MRWQILLFSKGDHAANLGIVASISRKNRWLRAPAINLYRTHLFPKAGRFLSAGLRCVCAQPQVEQRRHIAFQLDLGVAGPGIAEAHHRPIDQRVQLINCLHRLMRDFEAKLKTLEAALDSPSSPSVILPDDLVAL